MAEEVGRIQVKVFARVAGSDAEIDLGFAFVPLTLAQYRKNEVHADLDPVYDLVKSTLGRIYKDEQA